MMVGIPLGAWIILPQIGDEVAVIDSLENVVGVGLFSNENMIIPILGDDNLTLVKDGLMNSEEFYLRLYQGSTQNEVIINVNSWFSGDNHYVKNELYVVNALTLQLNKNALELYSEEFKESVKIYPSPTLSDIYVEFFVPKEDVFIIHIIDIKGNKVKVVSSENLRTGKHRIKVHTSDLHCGKYFINFKSNYVNTSKDFEKL